jgi:hypothetical protein
LVDIRGRGQSQVERRARKAESRRDSRRQVERRVRAPGRDIFRGAQRVRSDERRQLRRAQQQDRRFVQRDFKKFQRQERRAARLEDRAARKRHAVQRDRTWEQLANRVTRFDKDRRYRHKKTRVARIGERVSPAFYPDYAPVRYSSYYQPTRDFYYRYDDDNGYLYRVRRDNDFVSALLPILGGAYSVGRPLPYYNDSYYNVPSGYSSLYYDSPNSYYRYGDGAIYQVDPTTQLISGVVALLTGQSLGIGQTLPLGYDVYNVPYNYRSRYYDTDDMWYRYDDGYIYGVDPQSRLIQTSYPVYGGYSVGEAWPSYAGYGYDYGVPDYYGDLYHSQPGYDYRYASGGIYEVDPQNQLISALVALVTGQNFAVGQRLPVGYDAYNVPFAYRDRYYDNDENLYRYADGRIYQVNPGSRLIERVIVV